MQKGSVLPLVAIFSVILSASGFFGYRFLFDNRVVNKQNLVKDDAQKNSQIKVASPSASAKDQIYSNPNLPFIFGIPDGFSVREESEEEYFKRANGNIRKNFADYVFYEPARFVKSLYVIDGSGDMDKNPFSLVVFENPKQLDEVSFYNKYWYYPFVWGEFGVEEKKKYEPKGNTIIGSKDAYIMKGFTSVVDYQVGSPMFIYVHFKDKMYLLRVINDEKKIGETVFAGFRFPAKVVEPSVTSMPQGEATSEHISQ